MCLRSRPDKTAIVPGGIQPCLPTPSHGSHGSHGQAAVMVVVSVMVMTVVPVVVSVMVMLPGFMEVVSVMVILPAVAMLNPASFPWRWRGPLRFTSVSLSIRSIPLKTWFLSVGALQVWSPFIWFKLSRFVASLEDLRDSLELHPTSSSKAHWDERPVILMLR